MSRSYFLGAGIHTCLGRGVKANIDAMFGPLPQPQILQVPLGEIHEPAPVMLLHDAPLEDVEQRLWRVIEAVASEALDAAGLSEPERRETVLLLGSSSVDIAASEAVYQRELRDGVETSPLMANSSLGELADRIRRRFNLAGADYTISTACTASANALVYADALARSGRAKFALVMGVETFNIITALGFHGLSLLAPNGMRPFDKSRGGIVLGEGCSALVVGPKRGDARFHLRGSANLCDIFGMSTANPDGTTVSGVIKMALDASGVKATEIAGIKTHGTASLLNDEAESAGMRQVFAELPQLCALKPFIGHTFGACGLNELILLSGLVERGYFPAAPGICTEPSDLDITLPQKPPAIELGVFMLNYFGFGGNNTSLVVANVEV
jgi:3-oxoacyl-[acyl-carrier-protein] synthase I